MMAPSWCGALGRYNCWMNEKVYGLAATLSDEARKSDQRAFFRSIHRTFTHILVADRIWLGRMTGAPVGDDEMGPGGIRSLDQELHADFDELWEQRKITDQELLTFASGLSDEFLAGPLRYVRFGQKLECPRWWAVAQTFNHQTHHRGQITTLFTQLGLDVGVTDLFAMLRDEAAPVTA